MTDRVEIDAGDFEALMAHHRPRLYRVALGVVADPELAADVVQETLLRAWRGLERFRGDSSLSTWLHRIAVNTALTARSKAIRRKAASLDAIEDIAAESTPANDPVWHGELADLRTRLESALAVLPAGQRAVVVLKDVEDWSHSEIAERLGISESAAKVRLHRAHRRLARLLEADR